MYRNFILREPKGAILYYADSMFWPPRDDKKDAGKMIKSKS